MKRQKKWKKTVFDTIVVVVAVFCIWIGLRLFGESPCLTGGSISEPSYSEQERVMKAIALSYLVYGCEGCTGLQGTVNEMLDQNVMGIIAENFGIRRKVQEDPASAIVDTGAFIREQAGEFRFLQSLKDEKSGFYGAAFCDDENKCIWISFSGSVTGKDALACVAFVVTPWLSSQEKSAFALYEAVRGIPEVETGEYAVLLTGHSLGGALACEVSCASGCRAVTINGATGVAIDKMRGLLKEAPSEYKVSNYLTSPKNGTVSFMDVVQRLMFLGAYKRAEYYLYEEGGLTEDAHSVFSFLQYAKDGTPKLIVPDAIQIYAPIARK